MILARRMEGGYRIICMACFLFAVGLHLVHTLRFPFSVRRYLLIDICRLKAISTGGHTVWKSQAAVRYRD